VALDFTLERGAADVTVKEICDEALVSTRTFFNYYGSKAAAILGISATGITDEQRERFVTGTGSLLADTCDLVADFAESSGLTREDRLRVKSALKANPELGYEMFSMMHSFRCALREVLAQRGEPREVGLVLGLVFAAVPLAYTHEGGVDDPAGQLRETVAELGEVARGV